MRNNPPDPHSARFAKVAWPIVAPREGLPRPGCPEAANDDQKRDDLRPIRGVAIGLGYSAIVWTVVAAGTLVWMVS